MSLFSFPKRERANSTTSSWRKRCAFNSSAARKRARMASLARVSTAGRSRSIEASSSASTLAPAARSCLRAASFAASPITGSASTARSAAAKASRPPLRPHTDPPARSPGPATSQARNSPYRPASGGPPRAGPPRSRASSNASTAAARLGLGLALAAVASAGEGPDTDCWKRWTSCGLRAHHSSAKSKYAPDLTSRPSAPPNDEPCSTPPTLPPPPPKAGLRARPGSVVLGGGGATSGASPGLGAGRGRPRVRLRYELAPLDRSPDGSPVSPAEAKAALWSRRRPAGVSKTAVVTRSCRVARPPPPRTPPRPPPPLPLPGALWTWRSMISWAVAFPKVGSFPTMTPRSFS
mmetsp:Transcript_28112/g.62713  ORF Transcript_28112/g.62713 Transcript_28112/m.62713 type:complete len:350 (+) Transcript_28112:239-1288(+)